MTGDSERLFELFDRSNRDAVFRVSFADGDEYELTRVTAAQDEGELPHGTASVVRAIRTRSGSPFPQRNAMFFRLPEITQVADAATGEILFRAS